MQEIKYNIGTENSFPEIPKKPFVTKRSITRRDANRKFGFSKSQNMEPFSGSWRKFRKNGEKFFENAGNNIDPEYVTMIDNILSVNCPNYFE